MPGYTEPTTPARFLGCTVLSFNASLGLGSAQESSLTVDLIEDCDAGDVFTPETGAVLVGDPVVFPDSASFSFSFGGYLQSWTKNYDSSGKTYKVVVTDPRQLLQNFSIILDSYLGPPTSTTNYFNAYYYLESSSSCA